MKWVEYWIPDVSPLFASLDFCQCILAPVASVLTDSSKASFCLEEEGPSRRVCPLLIHAALFRASKSRRAGVSSFPLRSLYPGVLKAASRIRDERKGEKLDGAVVSEDRSHVARTVIVERSHLHHHQGIWCWCATSKRFSRTPEWKRRLGETRRFMASETPSDIF